MLREVYARVEVTGPAFAAVQLTPDAAELGLTVALPETVSVAMASPAGPRSTGRQTQLTRTVSIVDRAEWESAIRSA